MGVYRTESNNGHVKIAWCAAGDGFFPRLRSASDAGDGGQMFFSDQSKMVVVSQMVLRGSFFTSSGSAD